MAIGPVQLLVLGFSRPDSAGPLDLVAVGPVTAAEADRLQPFARPAAAMPAGRGASVSRPGAVGRVAGRAAEEGRS